MNFVKRQVQRSSSKSVFELPQSQNPLQSIVLVLEKYKLTKDEADISGKVLLTLNISSSNFPVHIELLGESYCCDKKIDLQVESLQSFRSQIYGKNCQQISRNNDKNDLELTETNILQGEEGSVGEREMVKESNNIYMMNQFESSECFRESPERERMESSQNYNLSEVIQLQNINTESFLEGSQTLFQFSEEGGDEKISQLEPNREYQYNFTFHLPFGLPVSMNSSNIFDSIDLLIRYRIIARAEFGEKTVSTQKQFEVVSSAKDYPFEFLTNSFSFRFFHANGSQRLSSEDDSKTCLEKFSQFCCKCFRSDPQKDSQKLLKSKLQNFDICNCQVITTVNTNNVLHITVRIFLEPMKQKLNQRKIKKGQSYTSDVVVKPGKTQKRSETEGQGEGTHSHLSNSKMVSDRLILEEISACEIKMWGQMKNVRKHLIFTKMVPLEDNHFDMLEGEVIVPIDRQFFSEENQLYNISFWLEVDPLVGESDGEKEPLSSEFQIESHMGKVKENTNSDAKQQIEMVCRVQKISDNVYPLPL